MSQWWNDAPLRYFEHSTFTSSFSIHHSAFSINMITTPDRQYSTRLRTALVLTGSGTGGAYHAGILRAFHEAGIKIDLVAARGIGVVGAMFAAMDGAARLWDDKGVWRNPSA